MPNGTPSVSRCSNCGSQMAPRDIICVECGFNVITRQRLRRERTGLSARVRDFVTTKSNVVLTGAFVVLVVLFLIVVYAASRDYLTDGRRYYEAKRWQEAEESLRQAIEHDPESSQAHYYLGMVLARKQALGLAVQEFEQAASLDPRSHPAKVMLGVSAGLNGDFERSASALQQLYTDNPTYPKGAGLYGLALLSKGDFNSAVEPLERAVRAEPGELGWREALATAQVQAGKHADANAILQTASGTSSQAFLLRGLNESVRGSEASALSHLKTAVRQERSDDESLRFLGISQVASGDHEGGIQTIRSVLPRLPRDVELRFFYGSALVATGSWSEAIQELEQVVGYQGPYEAVAQNQLGLAYLISGNTSQAISHLDRAVDLEGKNPHFLYTLGLAYQMANQDSQALQRFKQAATLDSSAAEPHVAIAGYYARRGNFTGAASELNQFVRQAGSSVDTRAVRRTIEALNIIGSQPGRGLRLGRGF